MADFYGTTVSEGGKIKPSNIEAVETIISDERYVFGEINIQVEDGRLTVWGYDTFEVHSTDYEDLTEDFLTKLHPHMETPLIISCAGAEKCRYVSAWAWIVGCGDEVICTSLDQAINAVT